jgi:hypothetical protein
MKSPVRWLLFEYKGLELVILSKPFKKKELAEKSRLKYPDRVRRKIGIGVVRAPNQKRNASHPLVRGRQRLLDTDKVRNEN